MRLATIFIAACLIVIAASAGATVFLGLGASVTASTVAAIAILAALGIYHAFSDRLGLRGTAGRQINELSRSNFDLTRQVTELGRQLASLESRMDAAYNRARSAADPLAIEISELGTLVRQLAETVATYEARFGEIVQSIPAQPPPAVAPVVAPVADTAVAPTPAITAAVPAPAAPREPAAAPPTPAAIPVSAPAPQTVVAATLAETIVADVERLTAIRSAIEANRVDLYLQPIVSLPQRKVRFYEAMSRLRTETGEVIPAANFISHAQRAGLMARIDNLVVFRCVQIVRRLLHKNREIGLFCNLSESALTDAAVFQQLLDFLEANRTIASSLILEFTQSTLRSIGPLENEALSALAEVGFRFSLDNLQDLRIEPRDLAARGFRYVKIPGSLLLNPKDADTDIHPADLSVLLGRFGIDLIAERVETESMAVDLLDYSPRLGQGFLFSPPRPVRAEAMQGLTDRTDTATRNADAAHDAAAADMTTRDFIEEPAAISPGTRGLAQLARGAAGRV